MVSIRMSYPRELFGFEVLAHLGSGARSSIYAVKDKDDQVYALKHVVKEDANDQRFLDQALTDHNVASMFNFPNLRRGFRVIRHRKLIRINEIALLMELVDGQTLEDLRAPNMLDVCILCQQVAMALVVMHDAGWVHADIKPNNILITHNQLVKLIDFGQSCKTGTVKQRIQGTPDYIAPEQVRCEPITAQTDIFNLGATIYWLLTGKHIPTMIPKGEPGLSFKAKNVCLPPNEINPTVPPALSTLVMECIQTQPRHRPGSMSSVSDRLKLSAAQYVHHLRPNTA